MRYRKGAETAMIMALSDIKYRATLKRRELLFCFGTPVDLLGQI